MHKELTDVQKEICKEEGKFVVRACPGSGKTFTVAAKLAELIKNWPHPHRGIAAISFTNVAWQEIQRQLNTSFGISIPVAYPHFLGTIDSFINKFIFLQHGHLVLKCDSRPKLSGEPIYPWKYKKQYERDPIQYFDKISFDINGELIPISRLDFRWQKVKRDGTEDKNYLNIKKMKKRFLKRGYANQSDANYFSMKLLDKYSFIAKTICTRFPYIIIDEAQDISEIQMQILNFLIENELENLILIGDPDQAIFEWNDANPELFNEKIQELDELIIMNENWRSSQKICNFTYYMSGLDTKSNSINKEIKNYNHKPEIWGYDTSNPNFNIVIDNFLRLCKSENIPFNSNSIAVLARSKNLINKIIFSLNPSEGISQEINPWINENFTKELLFSKYLYDHGHVQEAFKLLERTYMSIIVGYTIYSNYELKELINERGYYPFKKEIFDLIKSMPSTNCSICEWITLFKKNIRDNYTISILEEDITINGGDILRFEDVFINENCNMDYRLSTIHKVKGETFDAVLLILKNKAANKQLYKNMLNRGSVNNEELRNVYVGITRPKKILILAVPDDDKKKWEKHFSGEQRTLDSLF